MDIDFACALQSIKEFSCHCLKEGRPHQQSNYRATFFLESAQSQSSLTYRPHSHSTRHGLGVKSSKTGQARRSWNRSEEEDPGIQVEIKECIGECIGSIIDKR